MNKPSRTKIREIKIDNQQLEQILKELQHKYHDYFIY